MKHILIIDDNESISEVMQMILEMEGYQTSISLTGKDIIATIGNLLPDLILLDVMLDGYDGRKICVEIKNNVMLQKIPLILISATESKESVAKGPCHPDDFIAKPFDVNDFIQRVSRQLLAA